MKIIPKPMKRLGRLIINEIDKIRAAYWLNEIKKNPQKHAKLEVKRQKQELLRPVNIDEPIYFSEKMLWLKYFLYNDSPLIAQCYNKYEVREYVKSKKLEYILNDLYGVWTEIDDIPWNDLPEEYVMKISNGYAGHVFKRKEESFNLKKAIKTLKNTKKKYNYFYAITGDLFVGNTKQYIIGERRLHSNLGYKAPEDYKFYCFNGVPKYIEFMYDREGGSIYNEVFVDLKLNDRHDLEGDAGIGSFTPPVCLSEMMQIAKVLSADFPFVRVDLYVENNQPIFGELTFTPFHRQTSVSERELGELLDLSNIGKYRKILSKKIED